jgi:hypothetical protein
MSGEVYGANFGRTCAPDQDSRTGAAKEPQAVTRRADADGASYRTVSNRRESDLAFLTWVRTVEMAELVAALRTRQPEWRVVAIQRAIRRLMG